ncbi:MAG: sigma 54-interacting transcriptional regulator, partial [Gemmatimonadota bacterium]
QGKFLSLLETQRFRRVGGTEEIHVAVHFLAATNEDLEQAVRSGRFRQDLYYRLNVIPLELPPLRERGDDVLLLAQEALREFAERQGVGPRRLGESAVALLRHYSWPGNVRELRNVMERAVVMTDRDVIRAEDLVIDRRVRQREEITPGLIRIDGEGRVGVVFPPQGLSLEALEQELVRAALRQAKGSVTGAARLLALSRDTLRYRLSKYGIDPQRDGAASGPAQTTAPDPQSVPHQRP